MLPAKAAGRTICSNKNLLQGIIRPKNLHKLSFRAVLLSVVTELYDGSTELNDGSESETVIHSHTVIQLDRCGKYMMSCERLPGEETKI